MVNVRKFVGKTSREALASLKAELGADAVVLSNRTVPEGVEIVAMPADAMGELSATVRQARTPAAPAPVPAAAQPPSKQLAPTMQTASGPAQDSDDDFTVTLGQHIARLAREKQDTRPLNTSAARAEARFENDLRAKKVSPPAAEAPVVRPFNPPRVSPRAQAHAFEDDDFQIPAAAPTSGPSEGESTKVAVLEATNARLMDELSSIKGLLERQLAGFAWSEISRNAPARTQMMSELLEAGFSSQLTRQLTEGLAGDITIPAARTQVKNLINRKLRTISTDADIIDRGGVYALVGPTGVGKTTTTAKLAARCVVRHGADKLALVTTDGYRIGAHEQLRIYGRILGVQVHVVRDAADLRQTLQDLRHKHMVLIDTIGMSQRDKMVMEQAAMLNAAGCVRRLLCLNATVRGDTLDDVIRAYEGPDLAGCIFTKVDEAASLAPVMDVAIRHEFDVFYVANGQRVPEDLHLPNRSYLVHRALKEIAADSAHKLDKADTGLLMAGLDAARNQPRGAAK